MENKRKELKTILLIALLGALWGALEIVFGNILHSMKFPFRGVIMSCMGMLVVSIGYFSNPKPGTCVCIGLIAAFLKFFSMGAFKLNPVLGITLEALAAELIFSLGGKKVATVYIVFIIN